MSTLSGGCQCGAVRYSCEGVSHASICHCRMCQKAFGNVFSPMAKAHALVWTRGQPKRFRSSNKVRRGFCANCGTPLTYETDVGAIEIALCTLDHPEAITPILQLARESRVPWVDGLAALPERGAGEQAKLAAFYAGIVSHQHPDHDTSDWDPPR